MAGKSWGDTSAPTGGAGDIRRLDWRNLVAGGPGWKIRLVGDLLPNFIYWVTTKDGLRTKAVANFNRDTEQFDNSIDDPIGRLLKGKDPKVENAQFAYVTNCINRADGLIYILELKATVYNGILDYAKKVTEGYGNPSHDVTGYDLTIEKKKTGPLKQNVKYVVTPSRSNTPLTADELALERYDLNKLYKQETPDEQLTWIMSNSPYAGVNAVPGDNGTSTGYDPNDDVPF